MRSKLGYGAAVVVGALCLSTLGVTGAVGSQKAVLTGDSPVRFRPGSPGVGDAYFPLEGNGGYDVQHYGLALTYLPSRHHLGGTATIFATATQNLSRFDLDLKNYKVGSVTVNGGAARFARQGQELVVTPRQGLLKGNRFIVVVAYAGTPHTVVHSPIVFGAPYGWIYTKDGAFVGCAPNAASTWYPSNDHPSDKATFRFDITVPTGTKVVSNGELIRQISDGSRDTFTWSERAPMATYLATVDIGRYDFHSTRTDAGIPEFVGVDPALEQRVEATKVIGLTGDITDYWAKLFGPYPFSSTGAIIDNVPKIGFSLETQTRPLYGFVPDPGTASHELAHQWFGDSVSVERWRDIWLNEGFAVFANWLWTEHTTGRSTYATARHFFKLFFRGDRFWKQSIADPGRDTMFSFAVYYRGGMTFASLRHRIGDRKFFTLMKTWATQHRYGNVTTRQFTDLAEKVSGRNLDGFFRTWLWDQTKPPKI